MDMLVEALRLICRLRLWKSWFVWWPRRCIQRLYPKSLKRSIFSVSVDSTPDLSLVDHLTVIVRYLRQGESVERFLTFLQLENHKAETLAVNLLQYLENESINFADCRGQTYDNASNVLGRYCGMQAYLTNVNLLAFYIHPLHGTFTEISRSLCSRLLQGRGQFFRLSSEFIHIFLSIHGVPRVGGRFWKRSWTPKDLYWSLYLIHGGLHGPMPSELCVMDMMKLKLICWTFLPTVSSTE